jgi:hypothetical protein
MGKYNDKDFLELRKQFEKEDEMLKDFEVLERKISDRENDVIREGTRRYMNQYVSENRGTREKSKGRLASMFGRVN